MKDNYPSSNEDLEFEIVANCKLLDEQIALNENISKVLTDTNTKKESLPKKQRKAFDLYQSRKSVIKANDDVKLYPWQQQATDLIQTPTHREVIWVKGSPGNEDKTWFQKYAQS